MVKICSKIYPQENEEIYKEHFDMFDFPLSDFQKHAIEAIVSGNHTLICVPTGNGKTLPSEFAINYFVSRGKKVIYTSPIKALSNQKYYDFTQKYPHIKCGILTGDVKLNPEADVLIMTAEILQNALYIKKGMSNNADNNGLVSSLAFDMDFENELACVVHDEVHSINMQDRGHVWESIFMLLPNHVQNVMLSATLDMPEKFAQWIENIGNCRLSIEEIKKEVYLSTLTERVVPLIHYSFLTCTTGVFKSIGKDEETKRNINELINKTHIIQTAKGMFNESYYYKMKKMITLFEQKNVRVTRQFVLNQVCKYMVENKLLPCACFILSRKQLEIAANEITIPLLEDDSKVGYIVRRECEQLLRSKLPNFQEYLELPEYVQMCNLLEKGIATHHSGTIPILKEIVEILFVKGYIKLLFCTETFSCGLNMPIKTTLFTDVYKFDGQTSRVLYGHEYNQASGRAGRRGLDTVGHVIHLNNLFKEVGLTEYKQMMGGLPQKLVSKFKISYNLILNLLDTYNSTKKVIQFCKSSMIQDDINSDLNGQTFEIEKMEKEMIIVERRLEMMQTPREIVEKYIDCLDKRVSSVNKRRKELDREIQKIVDEYKTVEIDKGILNSYLDKLEIFEKMKKQYVNIEHYLDDSVTDIIDLLIENGFIIIDNNDNDNDNNDNNDNRIQKYKLTKLGQIACQLREIHCLTFAQLLENGQFDKLTPQQLIVVFSCFTNVSVPDDLISYNPDGDDMLIKEVLKKISTKYNEYQDYEIKVGANTGQDYNIHYDLINAIWEWSNSVNIEECKCVLQNLEMEKGIYLGEFVKAVLKINNISNELEKVADGCGNILLLSKLKEISVMTLKFVATNQSLYI